MREVRVHGEHVPPARPARTRSAGRRRSRARAAARSCPARFRPPPGSASSTSRTTTRTSDSIPRPSRMVRSWGSRTRRLGPSLWAGTITLRSRLADTPRSLRGVMRLVKAGRVDHQFARRGGARRYTWSQRSPFGLRVSRASVAPSGAQGPGDGRSRPSGTGETTTSVGRSRAHSSRSGRTSVRSRGRSSNRSRGGASKRDAQGHPRREVRAAVDDDRQALGVPGQLVPDELHRLADAVAGRPAVHELQALQAGHRRAARVRPQPEVRLQCRNQGEGGGRAQERVTRAARRNAEAGGAQPTSSTSARAARMTPGTAAYRM